LLPFEASSILLLLAAVGAVVLAGKRSASSEGGAGSSPEHSAPKARSGEVPAVPSAGGSA
ncbi:MAG: hypothetical protein WB709_10300, partial [Solirubrobacteraceae bacterium]